MKYKCESLRNILCVGMNISKLFNTRVEMAKVLGSITSPKIRNHIKFTADFMSASPILSHMSY
jgi:hypothetical protein